MNLHSKTPRLLVNDPRGLTARTVDYCRAQASLPAEARIQLTLHDASGRATQQWDPRLWRTGQANLVIVHSISNKVLSSVSVDAGWRVNLAGDGEQLLEQWDGRGTRRQTRYDQQLRPLEVFENEETAERLFYGDETSSDHNQCGRLIRHEDSAGVLLFNECGLNGAVLEQERRLIHDSLTGHVTRSRLTPLGDLQIQTDAQANTQRFSQTRDGRLRVVDLQLSNTTHWLPMVSAITYNADGQVEKEVAGNGVVTALEYFAEDGRLKRLQSHRGQHEHLQDLRYAYDSVGNVLCIEDAALPIRYFANQRIEPINRYRYDSLSQLIEATGWEAGTVTHGDLAKPSKILVNYRQTYRYDEANNLLELTHFGACNPGHRLVAASHSNRCLPVLDGMEPGEDDFRDGFDANGNLLMLQRGVSLRWNRRNQLDQVRPVERGTGTDDSEHYLYGADGMRVRKIRVLQTSAQANIIETVYLPGLEIRTHSGSGEELHVIDIRTGRGNVRVLHWEAGRPSSIANNQQRYSLTDHLGSGSLELDQDANIITRENYYPFGGTAWSDGEAVQVSYKTHRYSGKERDATGLDYYGFRYYASERQRWLNPDPAANIDGLNMYRAVRNSPMVFSDPKGLSPQGFMPSKEDDAFLDDFFSGSKFQDFLTFRKEMRKHESGARVFGLRVPNPFKKLDSVFDSREKLKAADYQIKNGLLYRAHLADKVVIEGSGLLRNPAKLSTTENYKSYIADVFKHTAGTGSEGAILSLSTKRDVAKNFATEKKTLVTIDVNKLEPELAEHFMTVPRLILNYGGMMLREKRIEHLDLIKALDQLNNKEHEVFFMGRDNDLNTGEIPPRAIAAVAVYARNGGKPKAQSPKTA